MLARRPVHARPRRRPAGGARRAPLLDVQHAGEGRVLSRRLLLLLLVPLQVGGELVEEVVDDVGGEHAHAHVLGQLARLLGHGHVEGQDDPELLHPALDHGVGAHHVPLVHRPQVDAGDRDLDVVGAQELEQRLQRAQRGGLHRHALARLVHRREDVLHVLHHLSLDRLHVVARPRHVELRARHRGLQVVRSQLDAHRGAQLLVVHVRPLDAHLLHGLGREQRADGGHDGPVEAAHHDGVALAQPAVDQHHVDGGAQPLDLLHLQHRALQVVHEHEALRHQGLRELDQDLKQVGDACGGRAGGRRGEVAGGGRGEGGRGG